MTISDERTPERTREESATAILDGRFHRGTLKKKKRACTIKNHDPRGKTNSEGTKRGTHIWQEGLVGHQKAAVPSLPLKGPKRRIRELPKSMEMEHQSKEPNPGIDEIHFE